MIDVSKLSNESWLVVREPLPHEKEFWARFTGIHPPDECAVEFCAVHAPSPHHMRELPLVLRLDRADGCVERVCKHGVGHPDPDWVSYRMSLGDIYPDTHGCCHEGCCADCSPIKTTHEVSVFLDEMIWGYCDQNGWFNYDDDPANADEQRRLNNMVEHLYHSIKR